jgi:flagellar hook-length control protein FliK
MEIQRTSATQSISSDSNNPPKDFSKLQPGSSLNAVVLEKSADNAYTLKLSDGRLLHAQTQNELQPGQVLKLVVVKPGAVPELKIVMPTLIGQTTPFNVQNVLRQMLPKQVNLTDFVFALKQFANLATDKSSPISAAVQQTLGTLLSKEDLMTAEGLKQGINNSGVFLEAKIAHQLTPQGDIKASLLTLANTLQKATLNQVSSSTFAQPLPNGSADMLDQSNALLSKTEGAIARIVLDQLASLPQSNEPQNTWQIGIPFTHGAHTNTVNLKIANEGKPNQDSHQANWSVVLELNPPGMGIVHCKISLNDDKVDTYFWSDFRPSLTQVEDHLDALAKGYTEAGLTVGNLNVVDNPLTQSDSLDKTLLPGLLDEFA